ncbi:hypothetical protein A6770_32475 [Nostoc minutum NIES-26]|uniref:Uncharacterized protein n=1 Tax=Nostoc minutum NIES-26 TaxID=1844469 RepID=A0A367Q6I7_9NOSO|nr:hypothetical protein [Dendronalium sp. ChiSLP03b]MDZ8203386.1 hypothetical protein [Dendronalium sp. ChiSLP03b]RCJ18914.1 hypothetical protein A6770_32475 [Nostoc minutum NIES-26]
MDKLDKTNKSDGLIDLSSQEQEQINGGFEGLFFQQTAIDSFAEDNTNISSNNGSLNLSSSSRTGYSFRQITFGFTSSFSGRVRRGKPLQFLYRLIRNFGF